MSVSGRQYKYLFQQLSARGWRTQEPVEIPLEKPRLLRQLLEVAYGIPVPTTRAAADLRVPESLIQQILETHSGKEPTPSATASSRLIKFKLNSN
jgi:hypothetical protein